MLKILFVCHGNICRSPMAEFVMRDMLEKRGITDVEVASAATSTEELGNRVHRGTAAILDRLGIDCSAKRARQITASDYKEFDLIIGMDSANIRNMTRYFGDKQHKIHKLLDFTERKNEDISDPWYTGDFERTYRDIKQGCEGLIEQLTNKSALW
ncbi:MAG: low molecular weight phosphotyrosine protein phosphatase [Oscillospiraceae bacterium]|nr:low molecular weight phosphotyrosine protein phosphatase [Oscillospiraceae bacterium]